MVRFGTKNYSMIKNHSKSSQLNEMNGNGTMRHMAMNDKIDRLHALNKVILSEDSLYSLDLQGNIHIINLEQEKMEKRES